MYSFKHEDRVYALEESLCDCIFNDELAPIRAAEFKHIASMFENLEQDAFQIEYYDDPCESCPPKPRGKKKLVPFLEAHFYLFTKQGEVITTSISPNFEAGSFDALLESGEVDQSYVLSAIVCPICGHFLVDIEQVEM